MADWMVIAPNCTWVSGAHTVLLCNGVKFHEDVDNASDIEVGTVKFYEYVGICVGLVLMAGVFSGLTLGLLSLDMLQLEVLAKGGHPHEQKYAKGLIPLVKHHHLLLVTLLLANAGVMEALPLFLDKLVPSPVYAIVISVTAVLIFGEVIPQSVCSRHGLAIGYYLAWFVQIMMLLMLPVAWPLAKLLDCLLGHDAGAFFRRAEFSAFVDLHKALQEQNEEPLDKFEVSVIQGTLAMHDKSAKDCMTNLDDVFMLSKDTAVLDDRTMSKIIVSGHSRIPLFRETRQYPTEFLLVKHLIKFNPKNATPIMQAPTAPLPKIQGSHSLFDLLHVFQEGKAHIAAVIGPDGNAIGVITMEDIMEELIGEEIVDETDVFSDLQNKIMRGTHSIAPSVLAKAMFPESADRLVTPGEADRPVSWQLAAAMLSGAGAIGGDRRDSTTDLTSGGTSRHVIRTRASSGSRLENVPADAIRRVSFDTSQKRTLLDTNSVRRLAGGGGGGGGNGNGNVPRVGSGAIAQRASSLGSSSVGSINSAGYIYEDSAPLLPK